MGGFVKLLPLVNIIITPREKFLLLGPTLRYARSGPCNKNFPLGVIIMFTWGINFTIPPAFAGGIIIVLSCFVIDESSAKLQKMPYKADVKCKITT